MRKILRSFLTLLLFTVYSNTYAHDIEVQNAYGVTIYYNYTNNGTELEVTYRGSSYDSFYNEYKNNVVIPDEVIYMNRTRKVTGIREYTFLGCSGLTSVTIPSSVTSIGKEAFHSCTKLTSVTIPNSVTSIGDGIFHGCSSLTSVTIPNSVTSIGEDVFYECTKLTSFIIPNSVTSIGVGFFYGCSSLTSVTIPNSVTTIGRIAFYGCSSLTSVTIPNSVTSIGSRAFQNCSSITSVTIPNSVTSIDYYAFGDVDIPIVISLIENPFKIYGKSSSELSTFSLNTFNNATLYVPKGTIDNYKATGGWKDFMFIEEMDGGDTPPVSQTCEKPTISYNNGKLTFSCATEGATCHYSITDSDIKDGSGNEVQLGVTYNISVYAAKEGYENSETATATLCWIDATPQTEGIANGMTQVSALPVLVKTSNGFISVEGVDDGTDVSIYTTDGKQVGFAVSQNNAATIATSVQPGSIAIVKIGEKAIKVMMK